MKLKDMTTARLLLVNEDKAELNKIHRWLNKAGCSTIKLTQSAHEVLTCYVVFNPDVVLFDLRTAAPNGLHVLERLAGLCPEHREVPIVALADPCSESEKNTIVDAGASMLLFRPLSEVELLLHVRNAWQIR